MTHTSMNRRDLTALLASGLLGACSRPAPSEPSTPPHLPPYTGPLVPPEEIPGNFLWQQRVTAKHAEKSGAFDAVLQKIDSELLVLGLTPFGTRGFSLTQRGTSFEYEQFVPFDLPFSPGAVLIDIHRTFFFELTGGPPTQEGKRKSRYRDEIMTDTWQDARLRQRVFEKVAGSEGSLKISYCCDGYAPLSPPKSVTIQNELYGYELTVETSAAQAI